MTVAQFETLAEEKAAEVMEWRFSQLTRSGFPAEDAIRLATRLDVDLHQATALVARGCPPSLARRFMRCQPGARLRALQRLSTYRWRYSPAGRL